MNKTEINKLAEVAFIQADIDGSGGIDEEELMTLIVKVSNKLDIDEPTQEEIKALLLEFDADGDGVLKMEEFKNFIQAMYGNSNNKKNQQNQNMNSSQDKDSLMSKLQTGYLDKGKKAFEELFLMVKKQSIISLNLQNFQEQLERQISCTVDPKSNKAGDSARLGSFSEFMIRKQTDRKYLTVSEIHMEDTHHTVFTTIKPLKTPENTPLNNKNTKSTSKQQQNKKIIDVIESFNPIEVQETESSPKDNGPMKITGPQSPLSKNNPNIPFKKLTLKEKQKLRRENEKNQKSVY